VNDKKNEANCKKKDISQMKKHKIIIIGDSHARGCASELKYNLDNFFEVQGFVKPGTTLETIPNTAKEDIEDIDMNSCVNTEVKLFNRKLQKQMKSFENTVHTTRCRSKQRTVHQAWTAHEYKWEGKCCKKIVTTKK
jgi:hypothetical protein